MKPFVRVLGAALLTACPPRPAPEEPTVILRNPPAPDAPIAEVGPVVPAPTDVGQPPTNPPMPSRLPTWDAVESGHPKGATNPPMPTLYVARDTGACFKDWLPGMIRPDLDILEVGGRVYAHESEIADATKIVCPDDQPAKLVGEWDKAVSEGRIGPKK